MANGFAVFGRLKDAIAKHIELRASKSVDARNVKTVCLALGPYRNLTTLTASMLFLHPNCQVLNHGGGRILNDRRLDFLKSPDRETFETFKRYAIHVSAKGRRGEYGGSIIHSHAFDAGNKVRELFDQRRGGLVKQRIDCLFWKESLRTANHIRANHIDLADLFARNDAIRFLLPVRNPLDCATSNLKTGLVSTFAGLPRRPSCEQVVSAILDEFLWVAELRQRNPGRFFVYFEHPFTAQTLRAAADFLRLTRDETWIERATAAFAVKSGYCHSASLIAFYRRAVEERFGPPFADFKRSLLTLCDAAECEPGEVAA